MRYLKLDDVKHLKGEDYDSDTVLLAKLIEVVSTFYDEEKITSTGTKKRKNTSSDSDPSSERDEILRKEKLLKKPMKEKDPSCCSLGLKLKFKFGGPFFFDQEFPPCSGSKALKIQEFPPCSGSKGLKIQDLPTTSVSTGLKIQDLSTTSGSKSFENQESPTGFVSKSLQIQKIPTCSGAKRRKLDDHQGPPPMLPQCLKDLILQMAGLREVSEPILVVQKELFVSDILTSQNRFMIPRKQMKPFLCREELVSLPQEVMIVEPNLNVETITLANWKMSSDVLVLRGNWSKVVARNSLGVGMIMQLWAVRIDNELLLVLVRVPSAILEGCNNGDPQASEKNADRED